MQWIVCCVRRRYRRQRTALAAADAATSSVEPAAAEGASASGEAALSHERVEWRGGRPDIEALVSDFARGSARTPLVLASGPMPLVRVAEKAAMRRGAAFEAVSFVM